MDTAIPQALKDTVDTSENLGVDKFWREYATYVNEAMLIFCASRDRKLSNAHAENCAKLNTWLPDTTFVLVCGSQRLSEVQDFCHESYHRWWVLRTVVDP